MKMYAKIKIDGVWGWFRLRDDQSGLKQLAAELCECRICRPDKPETISIEDEEWETHDDQELVYHAEDEGESSSSSEE